MSLESMMATQPVVRLYRSTDQLKTNDGGLSTPSAPTLVASFRGRMVRAGASQQAMWLTLGVVANYQLDTTYNDIRNGDIVKITDPQRGERSFSVLGVGGQWMGQGSIKSYTGYPCQENTR